MGALLGHLKMLNTKLGLDVEILGGVPDARIPGLEGPGVLAKVMEFSRLIQS